MQKQTMPKERLPYQAYSNPYAEGVLIRHVPGLPERSDLLQYSHQQDQTITPHHPL
jgi:hypothetical protein